LAVTYHRLLVYARGFGDADLEQQEAVQAAAMFRIASLTKPFTSAAVMRLVQQDKLKLDDRVFAILKLEPQLERGAQVDPRLRDIRVHQCLQHTTGWDRGKSFDPMSAATAEKVSKSLIFRCRFATSTLFATRRANRWIPIRAPPMLTRTSATACWGGSSKRFRGSRTSCPRITVVGPEIC
jgi:CubicO group peptidase (beta-lactamase class C family)